MNVQSTVITVPTGTQVVNVALLSPQQVKVLQPVNLDLLKENTNQNVRELIASLNTSKRFFHSLEGFCFPTPETGKFREQLNRTAKRIYDKLCQFKNKKL